MKHAMKPDGDRRGRRRATSTVVVLLGAMLGVGVAGFGVASSQDVATSRNPDDWIDAQGRDIPAKIPDRIAVAADSLGLDGAYVDSEVVLGNPLSALGRDPGPFDLYASPDSDKVVAWLYRPLVVVPVGTPQVEADRLAAQRAETTPPTTSPTPEAPPELDGA
jgi:hypothetical protein